MEVIEFDPSAINLQGQEKQDSPQDLLENNGIDLSFKLQQDQEPEKKPDEQLQEEEIKNPLSPKDINKDKLFSVVLGSDLKERGIISQFDEETISKIAQEQDDATAIGELFKAQTKAISDELKASYDQGYQEYLDLINGGVSKEDALEIRQLEDFNSAIKNIDLKADNQDSIQARKDLLTLNYRITTKWSDDKIQKYVDKLYDEGSDLDEIEEAIKNVDGYVASEKQLALEQAKQYEDNIKKSQEKYLSDINTAIEKTDEFFQGSKVSKETKQQMHKLMTTMVKLDNGQVVSQVWANRMKDPIKWDAAVAYLDAIGFFEGKAGNKFIKEAETKSTSSLQNYLNDTKGRGYNSSFGKSFNDSNSKSGNLLDEALYK